MVSSSIHVPQPGHAWPSQVTPGNEFVSPNRPMHAHKDNGDHSKGTMTQTGALLEGTLSSMKKQPRVLRTFLGCRYGRGAAVSPRLTKMTKNRPVLKYVVFHAEFESKLRFA